MARCFTSYMPNHGVVRECRYCHFNGVAGNREIGSAELRKNCPFQPLNISRKLHPEFLLLEFLLCLCVHVKKGGSAELT